MRMTRTCAQKQSEIEMVALSEKNQMGMGPPRDRMNGRERRKVGLPGTKRGRAPLEVRTMLVRQ